MALSLLGRLGTAMANLSLLLYVNAASGSYAFAGGTIGVSLIGAAIGAIGQGRLIDRFGPSRPLLALAAVYAPLSFGLITLVAARPSPSPLLACVVFAQGVTQPPLAIASRAMWPRLVPAGPQRQTAYSYETTSSETCFLIGPTVAAVLADVLWPGTSLTLASSIITTTAVGFALVPAARRHRGRQSAAVRSLKGQAVLRCRGMAVLLAAVLGFGTGIGFVMVGVSAAADALGAPKAAGYLLAAGSASSVLGGLAYNRWPWPRPLPRRLPFLMTAYGLLFCPVLIGGLYGVAAAVVLSGLTLAPQKATHNILLESLVPPHQVSEAFGWVVTVMVLGSAVGQAAGGAAVEASGHQMAFLIGAASILGFTTVVARNQCRLRTQTYPRQ
ncbi:MFS transporter [Streptomyces sp. NPDC050658]|uniref:MFS transporter n=1 Tax=unclassified Streptomyces TaxID=2593676 RepID=UPI0034450EC8